MEFLTVMRFLLVMILGVVAVVETWRAGKLENENSLLLAEVRTLRKAQKQTEDEQ